MDIDQKHTLAWTGDVGLKANAIRLLAARKAAGFTRQKDFAAACGVSVTSFNNMEKAVQFPNRKVLEYLFKAHRIDFNFTMAGHFAQLPGDVQDALFPQLVNANNEWDKKPN